MSIKKRFKYRLEFLLIIIIYTFFLIYSVTFIELNDNNIFVLSGLFLFPVLFGLLIKNSYMDKSYIIIIIWILSLALTSLSSFRSTHIIGTDIHDEYYSYKSIEKTGFWESSIQNLINSCISINIYPTIIFSIINLRSEFMYSFLYGCIISIIPIFLFLLVDKFMERKISIISTFVFISQYDYVGASSIPRQVLSTVFFIILIYLLSTKSTSKKELFIELILCISIILSHYATAVIVLILFLFTFIINSINYNRNKKNINDLLLFIYSMIFILWNFYLNSYNFNTILLYVINSINLIIDNMVYENQEIGLLLGSSFWYGSFSLKLEFLSSWFFIIMMVIGCGFIILVQLLHIKLLIMEKINDQILRLPPIIINLNISCISIMIFSVLFSDVLRGYTISRFYLLLSPITYFSLIIGVLVLYQITVSLVNKYYKYNISYIYKLVNKNNVYWILFLITSLTFSSVVGTSYEIEGINRSFLLNPNKQLINSRIITDAESFSTLFFRDYSLDKYLALDGYSWKIFTSQAFLEKSKNIHLIIDWKIQDNIWYDLVFISAENIKQGHYFEKNHSINIFLQKLLFQNKIYDNKFAQYWKNKH